jgi:hypothetical protein
MHLTPFLVTVLNPGKCRPIFRHSFIKPVGRGTPPPMFHTLELRAGVPAQEGTRAIEKKMWQFGGWSCGIHGSGAVNVIS